MLTSHIFCVLGEYDVQAIARLASDRALVLPVNMARIPNSVVDKDRKVGNTSSASLVCYWNKKKKKKKRKIRIEWNQDRHVFQEECKKLKIRTQQKHFITR